MSQITTNSKPQLIHVSPISPFPMVGGRQQRSGNLFFEQNTGFQQVLVTTYRDEVERAALLRLINEQGADIRMIPWTRDVCSRFKDLGYMLRMEPRSVLRSYSTEFEDLLREVVSEFPDAAVKLDTLASSIYLHALEGRRCFLDQHNAEYLIWERRANLSHGLKHYVELREARALKRYERDVLSRVHTTFAVSDADAALFRSMVPNARISVISNGVSVSKIQAVSGIAEERLVVGFLGPMSYLPNRMGVEWFLDQVWPKILEIAPQAEFHIIGQMPDGLKAQFSQIQQVYPLGFVDDLSAAMACIRVFVVPLHVGGGTRLKVLDAMAYGLSIVSTHIGAEGIALEDGQSVLFADDASTFSSAVTELLANPQQSLSLGTEARKLAEEQYGWSKIAKEQNAIIIGSASSEGAF